MFAIGYNAHIHVCPRNPCLSAKSAKIIHILDKVCDSILRKSLPISSGPNNIGRTLSTSWILHWLLSIKTHTLLLWYHTVTCNYPLTQSLHDPAVVVSGSQDSPPIEGQFITYTCPPGFILIGPNASVCTGNREWEPDPGQVACIGDCMTACSFWLTPTSIS